jgi:hypothetical protein
MMSGGALLAWGGGVRWGGDPRPDWRARRWIRWGLATLFEDVTPVAVCHDLIVWGLGEVAGNENSR